MDLYLTTRPGLVTLSLSAEPVIERASNIMPVILKQAYRLFSDVKDATRENYGLFLFFNKKKIIFSNLC